MDLWNIKVVWEDTSAHGEESYAAEVHLPEKMEAFAVITIGRGPEFGGHTILIYDKVELTDMLLHDIHSIIDRPLEDQAIAAIAALVEWVQEALYQMELDELDPNREFYVR